jgi:hypothetical protein
MQAPSARSLPPADRLSDKQQLALVEILSGRSVVLSGRSSTGKRTVCRVAGEFLKDKGLVLHNLSERNSRSLSVGSSEKHVVIIDANNFRTPDEALKLLHHISGSAAPFGGFRVVVIYDEDVDPSRHSFCHQILKEDPSSNIKSFSFFENFHLDPSSLQVLNFLDGQCDELPPSWMNGRGMYGDANRHVMVVTPWPYMAFRINWHSNAVAIATAGRQFYGFDPLVHSSSRTLDWTPTYILANPEQNAPAAQLREGLAQTQTFQRMTFVIFPWITDDETEKLAFRALKKTRPIFLETALNTLHDCGWSVVDVVNLEHRNLECVPIPSISLNLAVGSIISRRTPREEGSLWKTGQVIGFELSKCVISGWPRETLWPRVRYWHDKSEEVVLPELEKTNSVLHYRVTRAALPLKLSYAISFRDYVRSPPTAPIRTNPQWFLDFPHLFRYIVARSEQWRNIHCVGGAPPYALLRRRLAASLPLAGAFH